MNNRRYLPLAAVLLAVAGCDFKETRSGQITLLTSAGIPLNGRAGRAELVAGKTEITFKKGSSDKTIAIRVRQPNRPDIELEAAVSRGYETGNFTLVGSAIGQPVDMASARAYEVTGAPERESTWTEEGMQTCRVDIVYEPCAENWTVTFRAAGADLGSFASRESARCNERRGMPYACHRDREIPDHPRGPGGRHGYYNQLSELGAANVKFD